MQFHKNPAIEQYLIQHYLVLKYNHKLDDSWEVFLCSSFLTKPAWHRLLIFSLPSFQAMEINKKIKLEWTHKCHLSHPHAVARSQLYFVNPEMLIWCVLKFWEWGRLCLFFPFQHLIIIRRVFKSSPNLSYWFSKPLLLVLSSTGIENKLFCFCSSLFGYLKMTVTERPAPFSLKHLLQLHLSYFL